MTYDKDIVVKHAKTFTGSDFNLEYTAKRETYMGNGQTYMERFGVRVGDFYFAMNGDGHYPYVEFAGAPIYQGETAIWNLLGADEATVADVEGKVFKDTDEAMMAYSTGVIKLHSKIKVRRSAIVDGEERSALVDTTMGKIIFNGPIPQDLGFVDRTKPENYFKYEIDFLVGKKQLGKIIDACIKIHGTEITSVVLDEIKAQGYKYSTQGAITVAVCDAKIPPEKKEIIAKAEADVDAIRDEYMMGLRSNEERYEEVLKIWEKATNDVTAKLQGNLDRYNPIFMMADSGARGSMSQIRQLAGMRGLIANTSGKTIEIPIRANYREGLNILEYFISSRGARKGLADTALRTADSGYLTRRLVDVSQDVIIREDDCGSTEGLEVFDIKSGKQVIEDMHERLLGRYLVHDFKDENGNVLVSKDTMITDAEATIIVNSGVEKIEIRSVLGCHSKHGVCRNPIPNGCRNFYSVFKIFYRTNIHTPLIIL